MLFLCLLSITLTLESTTTTTLQAAIGEETAEILGGEIAVGAYECGNGKSCGWTSTCCGDKCWFLGWVGGYCHPPVCKSHQECIDGSSYIPKHPANYQYCVNGKCTTEEVSGEEEAINPGRHNCNVEFIFFGKPDEDDRSLKQKTVDYFSPFAGEVISIKPASDAAGKTEVKIAYHLAAHSDKKMCVLTIHSPCTHGDNICEVKSVDGVDCENSYDASVRFTEVPTKFTECKTAFSNAVIFSDWDDTIAAAGPAGLNLINKAAGADRTLPHGEIYPGVLQLYKDLGNHFIILSANPFPAPLGGLSKKNKHIFEAEPLLEHGTTAVQVYKGTLGAAAKQSGVPFITDGDWSQYAYDKEQVLLNQLTGVHRTVKLAGRPVFFFGDNGQGDLQAGYKALGFKGVKLDVFIRIVKPDTTYTIDEAKWKYVCAPEKLPKRNNEDGCLFLIKNYLEAALIISKMGISGMDDAWFGTYRERYCKDQKTRVVPKAEGSQDKAFWNTANPTIDFPKFIAEPHQKAFGDSMRWLATNANCNEHLTLGTRLTAALTQLHANMGTTFIFLATFLYFALLVLTCRRNKQDESTVALLAEEHANEI